MKPKTPQTMLAEFGYTETENNLYRWRVFFVRLLPDCGWRGWSTEGDKLREGKSTTTLKRYLESLHT